jgi:hypothetical protein
MIIFTTVVVAGVLLSGLACKFLLSALINNCLPEPRRAK